MLTEKSTFLSADGKTTIHTVRWLPDSGTYTKILQITHGMVEHIRRYEDFAEFLTARGYMVVGMDFLGHGASVLTKEQWGYFAKDHPSDVLIRDMCTLRKSVQEENPKIPYFMLGHSMGSYMLRKYLASHGNGLAGAVIMGTGYVAPPLTLFGMCIVRISAYFHGWYYRSRFVDVLTKGKPYRGFDLTGKDRFRSYLTKDVKIVEAYKSDPRCQFLFTLNGYMGLFEAVLYTCQKKNIEKVPLNLPLLFVSGKEDPVGNLGKGVKKVVHLFKTAGHKNVTCKLYTDDRHEILNETDKDKVYKDIYHWMEHNVRKL